MYGVYLMYNMDVTVVTTDNPLAELSPLITQVSFPVVTLPTTLVKH